MLSKILWFRRLFRSCGLQARLLFILVPRLVSLHCMTGADGPFTALLAMLAPVRTLPFSFHPVFQLKFIGLTVFSGASPMGYQVAIPVLRWLTTCELKVLTGFTYLSSIFTGLRWMGLDSKCIRVFWHRSPLCRRDSNPGSAFYLFALTSLRRCFSPWTNTF